jgi:hypothetical protein
MQYGAAIFAGIAASAVFWLIDKSLLTLSWSYQVGGIIACFAVFGGVGYWLASRTPDQPQAPGGTRIASGLRGKNIKATVEGVTTTGGGNTDIMSGLNAKGDIDANARNIKAKP